MADICDIPGIADLRQVTLGSLANLLNLDLRAI